MFTLLDLGRHRPTPQMSKKSGTRQGNNALELLRINDL